MNDFILFGIPFVEWIGYVASVLVLISLSLSSILRLRIFNLFGSGIFSFYGFYIGALPVGIMNFIIVLANIYYLRQLFFSKDEFEIIKADIAQEFVLRFLNYYKKDIQAFFPKFELKENAEYVVLVMMRNMNLAGIFIAQKDGETLKMELDYVNPQYRDYKNGSFFYKHFQDVYKEESIKQIITSTEVPQQVKYLEKMGFEPSSESENSRQFSLHLA